MIAAMRRHHGLECGGMTPLWMGAERGVKSLGAVRLVK